MSGAIVRTRRFINQSEQAILLISKQVKEDGFVSSIEFNYYSLGQISIEV